MENNTNVYQIILFAVVIVGQFAWNYWRDRAAIEALKDSLTELRKSNEWRGRQLQEQNDKSREMVVELEAIRAELSQMKALLSESTVVMYADTMAITRLKLEQGKPDTAEALIELQMNADPYLMDRYEVAKANDEPVTIRNMKPPTAEQIQTDRRYVDLRKLLVDLIDKGEAKTLAFDVGIDYGSLAGENKNEKLRELVTEARKQGGGMPQLLVNSAREMYPNALWPEFGGI